MKSILLLIAIVLLSAGCALDNNSGDDILHSSLVGTWSDHNIDVLDDGHTVLICNAVVTYHDDNTSSTAGSYTLNSPTYGNVIFNIDRLTTSWKIKDGVLRETITDFDLDVECLDEALALTIEEGAEEIFLSMKDVPFTVKRLDSERLFLIDDEGEETHYKRL